MSRYGGAKYGGIEPSRTTPNVFVYSDPSRGEAFGYNFDGWNEDQTAFLYTGEGRVGDQLMQDGNRAILEHGEHRRALRLFIARGKVKGTSTKLHEYIGEFSVDADEPYTIADAPDENGELRTVVVFRLHPVAGVEGEASDSSKAVGVRGGQVADLIDLEAVNAGTFDVGATGATTAERRESALVQRYVAHLVSEGHRVRRWRLCPPGVLQALVTDIYDEDTNELYEAKGTATRVAVRQAIGQLFDYRRHIPRPLSRLALLLPHRPNDDLVDLITGLGMACVYESETDEFQRVEGAET
jgi:5-methylcytosine-specific restriction protein A